MPKIKKEVVKQEADQVANSIPTFRKIDDVIFRNIAYFINLNRPLASNVGQGANRLYQHPKSDLIKFSHVCKQARQASLPHIWHTLAIYTLNDFRGLMKIYNHACSDQLTFGQVYGVHMKSIDVCIKDSTRGISQGNKRRRTFLHINNPGNVPEITYQDLILVLINLAKHFSNLENILFCFMHLPIPTSLTTVIEKNCINLHELTVSNHALMDPFDGNLPSLQGSVTLLCFEALGGNLPDLTDFSFSPLKDDEAPFGFRLVDNDAIYSDNQIEAIRIVQLCATGLQYRLETVILPYNEAFFTCPTFWSIWTWLKFIVWRGLSDDDCLLYRGWIAAFEVLEKMLKGVKVQSASIEIVKEIRREFLSSNDITLLLAKSPLSSLAEYRKMNLDEEEIVNRLRINNLQHILAKLQTDLDLFKTIIKSKDEVRRFAK